MNGEVRGEGRGGLVGGWRRGVDRCVGQGETIYHTSYTLFSTIHRRCNLLNLLLKPLITFCIPFFYEEQSGGMTPVGECDSSGDVAGLQYEVIKHPPIA